MFGDTLSSYYLLPCLFLKMVSGYRARDLNFIFQWGHKISPGFLTSNEGKLSSSCVHVTLCTGLAVGRSFPEAELYSVGNASMKKSFTPESVSFQPKISTSTCLSCKNNILLKYFINFILYFAAWHKFHLWGVRVNAYCWSFLILTHIIIRLRTVEWFFKVKYKLQRCCKACAYKRAILPHVVHDWRLAASRLADEVCP